MTDTTRTYEATILVRASPGRADYDGTLAAVRQTYEVEGAAFAELEKWEERTLAYPIQGETSALYLTAYFTASPAAVVPPGEVTLIRNCAAVSGA